MSTGAHQIEVVKFNAIWIGSGGINWDLYSIQHLSIILQNILDNKAIPEAGTSTGVKRDADNRKAQSQKCNLRKKGSCP